MQHAIYPMGPKERRLNARIDAYFAALGQGFNTYVLRRARLTEMRRLDELSDEELLARGITRERIPHHVFSDLFAV